MDDFDSFLSALIQRTPLIDHLVLGMCENGLITKPELNRRVTQFLKARRVFDELFYKSLHYSKIQYEELRQLFFDTTNGSAGELLYSNRPKLYQDLIKFWEKRLPALTIQASVHVSLIGLKERERECFRAAVTGNAGKLEILLSEIATTAIPFKGVVIDDTFDDFLKIHLGRFRSRMTRILIGKRDWAQRTLLHVAVYSHRAPASCVGLILEYAQEAGIKAALLDCKDAFGNTPLHLALRRKRVQIARKLIFEGADVFLMNNFNQSPLQLIYQQVPNVALAMMDMAVTLKGDMSSDILSLNVDFSGLICGVTFAEQSDMHVQSVGKIENTQDSCINMPEMDEETEIMIPHSTTLVSREKSKIEQVELRNLTYLLYSDPKSCSKLCTHPVPQLFLHLKWNQMKRKFYLPIFIQVTFCLMYFVSIVNIYFIDCPAFKTGTHCNWSPVTRYIITPTVATSLVRICYPLWRLIKTSDDFRSPTEIYLNFGTWLHLLFLCVVPLTIVPPYFQTSLQIYQYLFAVVGILIGTVLLMRILRESNLDCEIQSIYVYVYTRVLWRFVTVILTFSSAFLGFAICFVIVFSEPNSFSAFLRSTLGLFIMIHGEFDFKGTLANSPLDDGSLIFWTGQVLFVMFGSLITLVLIDVFLGYTVSDIKELRDKAEERRRFIQIEQMYLFEKLWKTMKEVGNCIVRICSYPTNKIDSTKIIDDLFVIKNQNRNRNRYDYMVVLEDLPNSLQAEFRTIILPEG